MSGSADMAEAWQEFAHNQRTSCLEGYKRAEMSMIVSAFSSTDTLTSLGHQEINILLTSHLRTYCLFIQLVERQVDFKLILSMLKDIQCAEAHCQKSSS